MPNSDQQIKNVEILSGVGYFSLPLTNTHAHMEKYGWPAIQQDQAVHIVMSSQYIVCSHSFSTLCVHDIEL